MKQLFAIAAALSLAATALVAQRGGTAVSGDSLPATFNFQSARTISDGVIVNPIGGRGGALVTGSPVSAKEINKTVQTLSDGTELENSHTTMFYRDSLGRTRTEPGDSNGPILILDPVAALRITINPSSKTAIRAAAPALAAAGRAVVVSTATSGDMVAEQQVKLAAELADLQKMAAEMRASTQTKNQTTTEDLGFLMQNGVLAQGTRTTLTIPQGQIGNNRDIHVVNERWYSKDLQMMVKSINSDPRFGVTTYELTGISQNAPDPTLFQIPTGYTITEGGRGARGGAGR